MDSFMVGIFQPVMSRVSWDFHGVETYENLFWWLFLSGEWEKKPSDGNSTLNCIIIQEVNHDSFSPLSKAIPNIELRIETHTFF